MDAERLVRPKQRPAMQPVQWLQLPYWHVVLEFRQYGRPFVEKLLEDATISLTMQCEKQ
jgi:hypothetical protein